MAYYEGRHVIVGDGGQIAYSDNPGKASAWSTQSVGLIDFKQVEVVEGLWIAAGSGSDTCYYSVDRAVSWNPCGATAALGSYALNHSNGLWMIGSQLGSGAIFRSSTGTGAWSAESVAGFASRVLAVWGNCGSGRWFAAGMDGRIASSDNEGVDWTIRAPQLRVDRLFDIAGN